jgi:hypothetical protein
MVAVAGLARQAALISLQWLLAGLFVEFGVGTAAACGLVAWVLMGRLDGSIHCCTRFTEANGSPASLDCGCKPGLRMQLQLQQGVPQGWDMIDLLTHFPTSVRGEDVNGLHAKVAAQCCGACCTGAVLFQHPCTDCLLAGWLLCAKACQVTPH